MHSALANDRAAVGNGSNVLCGRSRTSSRGPSSASAVLWIAARFAAAHATTRLNSTSKASGWSTNASTRPDSRRDRVNQQVQAVFRVRGESVQKVVTAAKSPESTLLPPQGLGYRVPSCRFEFGRGKTAADQTHAAPAVADGEASPVRLAREHGRTSGQR